MIGDGEKAHMEAHGHEASIAPPPFALGAVNLSLFTAGSHELCMLFGEAKDVIHQIERVHILGGGAPGDGEKRWVFVQERSLPPPPRYPLTRMFPPRPV